MAVRVLSCPHFPRCSGCSEIGVDYAHQLERKLEVARDRFARSGLRTFDASSIKELIPSPRWHAYRNRVKLAPRLQGGQIALGLYQAGTHRVVDIPGCGVHVDAINTAIETLRDAIARFGITLHDERSGHGEPRYVTVRMGVRTGEVLIGLVTSVARVPGLEPLAKYVINKGGGVIGVVQNINSAAGNVIFGRENRLVAGRPNIEEIVCDRRILLGITSFFQVNTLVAECAYQSILAALTESEDRSVTLLDLYSGVGTIGLIAAPLVDRVIAIETESEAVALAKAAVLRNGLRNVCIEEGLVEARLDSILRGIEDHGTECGRLVVAVNPPRKGVDPSVVDLLVAAGPMRIAYLSCAQPSLIRDLHRFEQGGYTVRNVELFDMFPQTPQVETLVVIERADVASA